MISFDHHPLGLNRTGQLFFQPLKFHLESPNLLVEFGLYRLLLTLLLRAIAGKEIAAARQ